MNTVIQDPTPESVHRQVMNLVNVKDYPYLKAYRQDLEESDLEYLRHNWDPDGRYLWLIKANGTELTRLGVHPKLNEYALAALASGKRDSAKGCDVLLVTRGQVKRISADMAKVEALKMDYLIEGRTIQTADGKPLASIMVDHFRRGNHQTGIVKFGSAHGVRITRPQKIALRHIAQCELVKAWQSFFCSIEDIQLNGRALFEEVESAHVD